MILTDKEMAEVRRALEEQSGLDEELMRRCGHLIHMGAFDEAVRNAFILLEEKLRGFADGQAMTGSQLANYVFSPEKGPLSKQLGHSRSEQEGLREIYSGAFKLFRNPTAHGVVDYEPAEGKAIVGLVDLLLRLLRRAEELPPPGTLPENVQAALDKVEPSIGAAATTRLHNFLSRCVVERQLQAVRLATQSIPFRRHAMCKFPSWDQPRSHPTAVFYLVVSGKRRDLSFPVHQYHQHVNGFSTDRLLEELLDLGCHLQGSNQEPTINLRLHNDNDFLNDLYTIVTWITDEFQESLKP